jgi:hypothetical protein
LNVEQRTYAAAADSINVPSAALKAALSAGIFQRDGQFVGNQSCMS